MMMTIATNLPGLHDTLKSTLQCALRCVIVISVIALRFDTSQATRLRDRDDLVIPTHNGRIRGVRVFLPTYDKVVDSYLGIPFAEPPVGHLRFRHPIPKEPWRDQEPYDATKLPNACYHNPDMVWGDFYGATMWNSPTRVSEDCLYLNVWVPKRHPRIRKSAVLVWIYGGGYYSGATTLDLYDGKLLAAMNDIIVVSIAYRVGALGFLTLDHPEAPGNAGLFDQLMGLEWVQQNIHNFGGDPKNVTIFGESAGGVSVSMHLLSPLSRAKFARAVMQSGSATATWATHTMREGRRRGVELGRLLHCDHPYDMDILAKCLRSKSVQEVVDEQWVSRGIIQFPFVPVIDGAFLTEHPQQTLKYGRFYKCPILIGSNLNEGAFFVIYELMDYYDLERQSMNSQQFQASIDTLFYHYPQYPHEASKLVLDAIAFEYTNWLDPNDTYKNINALDKAVGDAYFTCAVNTFAHAYASAGEHVFYYYFTQRYRSNPWPPWMGVLHGDEILFAFGEPLKSSGNFTGGEKRLSRKMMQYWTNFAKTG